MSSLEIRVCGRYRLEQKLFQGRHASVYVGKNVQSDVDCAIKCQPKSNNLSFVMNQGKVIEALQGGVGIPHLMWYGQNGDFRFVVTQLLGNTLQDYLQICGGKFSLKTTLMIADKILSTIQFIHYKNHLHRDIKPGNFLMGMGKKLHQIYAVDFAYSTSYIDPRTREHRLNHIAEDKFVGTLKFASLNVHHGNRNSRRDDLQSLGLMLVYFFKGSLPWSNAPGQTLKEKRRNIKRIYDETSIQKLCEGLPKQFIEYLSYCRSLKYDDIPDYNYLKRMFKEKFIKEGFQYDYIYDWILIPLRLKDVEISNRVPLNRFTKREDTSLSMCNCDYDFSEDLQLSLIKVEEKQVKKQPIKQEPPPSRKRAASTNDKKPKKQESKKGKKGDDCVIF